MTNTPKNAPIGPSSHAAHSDAREVQATSRVYHKRLQGVSDNTILLDNMPGLWLWCLATADMLRTEDGTSPKAMDVHIHEIYAVSTCKVTYDERLVKIDLAQFQREHQVAYAELLVLIGRRAIEQAMAQDLFEDRWELVEDGAS